MKGRLFANGEAITLSLTVTLPGVIEFAVVTRNVFAAALAIAHTVALVAAAWRLARTEKEHEQ